MGYAPEQYDSEGYEFDTERDPFDPEKYPMGSFVPPEVIERAYGVKRTNHEVYWTRLLDARGFLERHWLATRGIHIVIACQKGGLRVCLDEEAVDVIEARQRKSLKSFGRGHRQLIDVDEKHLTDEQRQHRMQRLARGAGLLSFLRKRPQPRLGDGRAEGESAAAAEPPVQKRLTGGELFRSKRRGPENPKKETGS